jgi:hypothetical protein
VVLRQNSSITVLNDSIIAAERRDVHSSTLISDLLGKERMLRISLFAGESKGRGVSMNITYLRHVPDRPSCKEFLGKSASMVNIVAPYSDRDAPVHGDGPLLRQRLHPQEDCKN